MEKIGRTETTGGQPEMREVEYESPMIISPSSRQAKKQFDKRGYGEEGKEYRERRMDRLMKRGY